MATGRVFAIIAQLTPAEFVDGVAGGWGSIRTTPVHTMSAEWGWIDRCGGPTRGPALKPEDYPTAESLIRQWSVVEAHVRQFLHRLHDDLRRTIEFELPQTGKRTLTLGELLEHSANHAVHHRGQVALLLRMLGHAPGNFDLLFYDGERREVIRNRVRRAASAGAHVRFVDVRLEGGIQSRSARLRKSSSPADSLQGIEAQSLRD